MEYRVNRKHVLSADDLLSAWRHTLQCFRNRCVGGNLQLRFATNSKKLTFLFVVMHWNKACFSLSTTNDGMITLQLITCLVFWYDFKMPFPNAKFAGIWNILLLELPEIFIEANYFILCSLPKVRNLGLANFIFRALDCWLLWEVFIFSRKWTKLKKIIVIIWWQNNFANTWLLHFLKCLSKFPNFLALLHC